MNQTDAAASVFFLSDSLARTIHMWYNYSMKFIYCIDDRNGLTFFGKRQSRDSELIKRVISLANGKKVWINSFSKKLFEGYDVCCDENFLAMAGEGEYCFIENVDADLSKAEGVVLYRWNRHYPSDRKLNVDFLQLKFSLQSVEEFVGKSHEKITQEIYGKEG